MAFLRLIPFCIAATLAAPVSAQTCAALTLSETTTLTGEAPADGYLCYLLTIPQPQNLSLEVTGARNTAVTAVGVYDARERWTYFAAYPQPLELRVFQVLRALNDEPFSLHIRFEAPGNGVPE